MMSGSVSSLKSLYLSFRKFGTILPALILILGFVTISMSGCALIGGGIDTVPMGDSIGIPEEMGTEYAIADSEEESQEKVKQAKELKKQVAKKEKQEAKKQEKAVKEEPTKKQATNTAKVDPNKPMTREAMVRAAGPEGKSPLIKRRVRKGPFYPGEYHKFSLTYFGVEAGTLDLYVKPYKFIKGRKVYHFHGHGKSTSVFSLFYRVNDTGDSFMDYDGLFSHKFNMKLDETLQQHEIIELYDQEDRKVHYYQRMVHKRKGFKLKQFIKDTYEYTQDAITAAFYLRTLDLKVGAEYTYPIVSNGKSWTVKAKIVRKEKIITDVGEFEAFVVKPETHFEGVLQKKGDVFFWISADEHKAFLKIDAKVKIGSVIAYLKELRYGTPDE